MIGHAKDIVQLCGKNRYKVTILFMHKRMRGNWVFIDMIKGGLLVLLTRFSLGIFNEGGCLLFRFHLYSTNTKQGSKVNTMHKPWLKVETWFACFGCVRQFHL